MTASAISVKSQFSQNISTSMHTMVSRSIENVQRRRGGKALDGLDIRGDGAQQAADLMRL